MFVLHVNNRLDNKLNVSGINTVVDKLVKYQSKYCNCLEFNLVNNNLFEIIKFFLIVNKDSVVIIHRVYEPLSWLVLFLLRIKSVSFAIYLHGAFMPNAQNKSKVKKKIVNNFILKYFFKHSNGIFCLTEFEKVSFNKFGYGKDNIFVIPNGIDTFEIDSFYKDKDKDKDKDKYILFLGRFDFYGKGIDLLLESCFKLKGLFLENKFKLIIHGYGNKKDLNLLSDNVNKYLLGDVVEVRGPIFDADKFEVISNSSALILPSRSEGFPVSVIEALALNRFCLLSYSCNLSDLIYDLNCGLLFDTTEESLSSVLVEFITKQDKYSDINVKDYVLNNFSWDEISRKSLDIYRAF